MIDVAAMNLTKRLAVLTDDSVVPITNLFDGFGEEVDEPEFAVTFVCGAGKTWLSGRLDAFERMGLQ